MADGHIRVTFESVMGAAGDTDTIAGQIEQQLGELKGYLAPMVSSWSGQASSDYQSLQARWDTSAADLNAVLRQIAGALRTAHGNYRLAESQNSSIWG
jgi:early secretory antigenic target protein ESAT-6